MHQSDITLLPPFFLLLVSSFSSILALTNKPYRPNMFHIRNAGQKLNTTYGAFACSMSLFFNKTYCFHTILNVCQHALVYGENLVLTANYAEHIRMYDTLPLLYDTPTRLIICLYDKCQIHSRGATSVPTHLQRDPLKTSGPTVQPSTK